MLPEHEGIAQWLEGGDPRRVDVSLARRSRAAPLPRLISLAAPSLATAIPAVNVAATLEPAAAARFAQLALDCVHKEYPNKIAHVLNSDADVMPPRALTPAFYGCYDWHSSVHGHWLLARLARLVPEAPFAAAARAALARSLTPQHISAEVAYLRGAGRVSFERPYGFAWLLQLAAELRSWDDPQARTWAGILEPLEVESAQRIAAWLPTTGGKLKARYLIHAVGPRMGEGEEDRTLIDATRNSLVVAHGKALKSIAFPAISTGIFGFPKDRCARIMLGTAVETLRQGETSLEKVVFCLWDKETLEIFQETAKGLLFPK